MFGKVSVREFPRVEVEINFSASVEFSDPNETFFGRSAYIESSGFCLCVEVVESS